MNTNQHSGNQVESKTHGGRRFNAGRKRTHVSKELLHELRLWVTRDEEEKLRTDLEYMREQQRDALANRYDD